MQGFEHFIGAPAIFEVEKTRLLFLRSIILVALILINLLLSGQPKQQYLFNYWGARNGLSSSEIMCTQQDAKGFIWIGTLNGLQRYDGRRFLVFQHNPSDPRSIPNDAIHSAFIDSKDRLWLKMQDNHVGYLNTSDFSFHEMPVKFDPLLLRDADSRFTLDGNGNPMLILENRTVLTYTEKTGVFDVRNNPFTIPENWHPITIYHEVKRNFYWIACDSGLVKCDAASGQLSYRGHNTSKDPVIDAYSDAKYTFIPYRDSHDRFWLLSWPPYSASRYYSYDMKTGKRIDWEPQISQTINNKYHETLAMTEQKDGTLWLFGSGLLARFNEKKQLFELVEPDLPGEFSIRYDGVRHVLEDRENNLWVSSNKGLYRFNPAGQFLHIIPNRRVGSDSVYTADVSDIIQLRNGDIVVSTWGSGLMPYDSEMNPVKRKYADQGIALGEGGCWCIHERPNGDIWRGHQAGRIYVYHAASQTTEVVRSPLFGESTVRQITEDRDGNLWIGTQSGKLIKWEAATNTFSLAQKFGSIVFRLYTDRVGDIWACTRSNGIFRIDASNGRVRNNYTAAGAPGERLQFTSTSDIIQYNDSLYIIGSGGLNILNVRTGKIQYFGAAEGLSSNTVNNIVMDKKGQLWVTVESGLCSVLLDRHVVSTYNENDGLPTTGFNSATTCLLRDGRIMMGTPHEVLLFNPYSVTAMIARPPKITITGISLMGRWLSVDSVMALPRLTIRPKENTLVIEYSTLTYQNSHGISYMLEGIDKDWIRKNAGQRQVVYNYLPSGNYRFKVRSENGDGMFSETTTGINIYVQPPFWKTWWFFCLLSLVVAGAIYLLDRQRVNRLLALQRVRSEIAGNLHEEVNMTLNNISLLSEMARIKADRDIERSKEYIDQISHKSHSMINAMDDILWSIDPENDSMEKSLLRMTEYADSLKNIYGARIDIALDKKVKSLKPDMKMRHEILLIFKQALRLIVEQAGGRFTAVHIDFFKQKLSIRLQDAGASLEKSGPETDETIRDMHTRAADIGAELDIQSDKGVAVLLMADVS